MLTEAEARKKILDLAHEFRALMRQKQYAQAKYRYDTALNVAVFMELEDTEQFFGERGDKGEVIRKGEFPEELVQKAFEMTAVRPPQRTS
ncbi:MAG: hypothetical protein J6D13_09840 [Clostridium sp.]|nr:hypothetical protein [Clostridium sp.]